MKKFLKKSAFFFFFILAFYAILSCIFKKEKNYNSAFVDKLYLLKKYKNQKKIILIGGSAIGWGVSAELIELQTQIKTINLGHYSYFGLIDYQGYIMDNLNDNDIIIFSPEWIFYFYPKFHDQATLDDLIKNNIDYGLMTNNYTYILKSIFRPLHFTNYNKPKSEKSYIYMYNSINNNGDIISHCNMKPTGPVFYEIPFKESIKISDFKKIYKYLIRTNVFILFPPTQMKVYLSNKKTLHQIQSELLNFNYKLIDSLNFNIYNDSSFFDAQYHLNCNEKENRTMKIINYLKYNNIIR